MGQFDSGRPFGFNSTNAMQSSRVQIDIWAKPDQVLTIGKTAYEGFKLVRYLKREVDDAVHEHTISDLVVTGDVLYLNVINFYPPKMDYEFNLVRQTGDTTYAIYKP